MVIPSPQFLVWAATSPCFSVVDWSDALQQCMSTALAIARATGRLYVPDPRVGNAVDLVALQRWFPLHINAYFLYNFTKLPSQTASGIDMQTLGSVNSVVRVFALCTKRVSDLYAPTI